jgi:hypothetical protein
MLRIILLAGAVILVAASIPAPAKAATDCQSWCLQNRCAHGAPNQQNCMQQCLRICEKKHKSKR